MKQMKQQIQELLQIQAPSGSEYKVSKYLMPKLEKLVDSTWLDGYGNLLGERKVGNGDGATILLSAHMDTVRNIKKDRKVKERNGVFTSTKGVLGGDDRAGIAIIMAVLRNIEKTSFQGTIKVAFSREEEIGCVGSGKIDPKFYDESDLAIVVDRRGNRDIVTGCMTPFCNPKVGQFFEECSAMLDMDWKATEGGMSDATTFSDQGVNSVNLSAGYYNEHTPQEMLVYKHMQDTVNLILQAFAQVNLFVGDFGEVPSYDELAYGYGYGSYGYFEDDFQDSMYEFNDLFGYTTVDSRGGIVYISQHGRGGFLEEVMIEEDTMDGIVDEYLRTKYGKHYKENLDEFKTKVALD